MKINKLENIFIIIVCGSGILIAMLAYITKSFTLENFILTIIFAGSCLAFSIVELLNKEKFQDIPIFGKRNKLQEITYLVTGIGFGICFVWIGIIDKDNVIFRPFLIGGGILFVLGSIFSYYVLSRGVGLNKISRESLDMLNARFAQSKKVGKKTMFIIWILIMLVYFFVIRRFIK